MALSTMRCGWQLKIAVMKLASGLLEGSASMLLKYRFICRLRSSANEYRLTRGLLELSSSDSRPEYHTRVVLVLLCALGGFVGIVPTWF